jgi:hypothetical protein
MFSDALQTSFRMAGTSPIERALLEVSERALADEINSETITMSVDVVDFTRLLG